MEHQQNADTVDDDGQYKNQFTSQYGSMIISCQKNHSFLKYFKIKSVISTRAIINLFYCVIKMKFNRLFLTNAVRKVRL